MKSTADERSLSDARVDDVVIIGAGPAGIATALQLKRHGMEPILLEQEGLGGLLKNANLIENYLGFPGGISGPAIIQLFKEQLNRARINVNIEKVLKLDVRGDIFLVKTIQRTLACRIAVIATGTKPCELTDIELSDDADARIYYEIHPIRNAANERIAIIGSGDLAFDYALTLSEKNDVMILNRGERTKCLPLLWQRAKQNKRISYQNNTKVKEVYYLDEKLSMTCQNAVRDWKTHVSYLVIAVGREPNLDFLSDRLRKSLDRLQNKKLLYQVGDVRNGIYRQTAAAAGNGIKAAMEIYHTLKGKENCE